MEYGTYDIETYDLGGGIAGLGAYDGKEFTYFDHDYELLQFMDDSPLTVWYAHNGGRYDVKYLLDIIKERYFVKYLLINGSLNLKAYRKARSRKKKKRDGSQVETRELKDLAFELRDSFLLLPYALKKLSKDFGVVHEKQEYTDYLEHKDKRLMREYLSYDVMSLHEVLKAFEHELGFDKLWLTTASTAMNVFKKKFNGSEWLKTLGKNKAIYREGYYGGRVEVFKRYGEHLYDYDVNSLYPAVMHSEQYPIGYPLYTVEQIPHSLGYYRATVTVDETDIPLLPYRDISGKLLFPCGTFTGWYYSPELELAEKLGYEIEIHEGYAWFDSCNPFKGYVDHFYQIKRNAEGARRYVSKLMLNSVYGKFAQREEGTQLIDRKTLTEDDLDEKEIYFYPEEEDIAYVTCKRYGDFIKPHISGFITSYGRCLLYKYMLDVGLDSVLYCDTDSVISEKRLHADTGDALGGMKVEHEIEEGVFLLPKVYAFKNTKGEIIIRAKGLSAEKLSYEDYVPALTGDYSRIRSEVKRVMGIKQKLNAGYTGHWYDTMLLEKKVHGMFNKRILSEDGIHTRPLILNQ